MLRSALIIAAISVCSLSTRNAVALDFQIAKGGQLQIYSSEAGAAETFVITVQDGDLRVVHSHTANPTYLSLNLVTNIYFEGDDDQDTVNNLTNKSMRALGGGGDDILLGGSSSDRLYGGQGADVLLGRDGADTLDAGDDQVEGFMDGGDGFDTIITYDFIWYIPPFYKPFVRQQRFVTGWVREASDFVLVTDIVMYPRR